MGRFSQLQRTLSGIKSDVLRQFEVIFVPYRDVHKTSFLKEYSREHHHDRVVKQEAMWTVQRWFTCWVQVDANKGTAFRNANKKTQFRPRNCNKVDAVSFMAISLKHRMR